MVAKKTDQENEASDNSGWLDDIDIEKVKKSSEIEILPKFEVLVNEMKTCTILSLPVNTKFQDGNWYFTMEVLYNGVKHQLVAQAKSLRYSLAVLGTKLGGIDKLLDRTVVISKSKGGTKEYPKAELYSVLIPE